MVVVFQAPMAGGPGSRGLEAEFGERIQELTQALWDFSGATKKGLIHSKFEAAMRARQELLRAFGGEDVPSARPPSAAAVATAIAANWKGALDETYVRSHGRPAQVSYVTAAAPTAVKAEHGPFISQVSSPDFTTEYAGEPAESKKKAEQLAARQAMAAEFPEMFEAMERQSYDQPRPPRGPPPPAFGFLPGGVKRKTPDSAFGAPVEDSLRSQVYNAAQLLCQRTLKKGDVIVDTQQVPGSELLISSITIVALDPHESYFGEACPTKKAAEKSACEAFLTKPQIASEVARLAELMKEKKTQKARRLQQQS